MKTMKHLKNAILIFTILISSGLAAQDLPVPSPHATVNQRVGITDIELNYSRPKKNQR